VPFAAEYRRLAVAVGVVSAYCTVIVFGSFWLRRLLGQRTWRAVHSLALPAFGFVTLHDVLAGSDSGTLWMRLVYVLSTTIVLWLVTYRLVGRSSARLLVRAGTGASAS
jgi:predicted ferric reductase